MENEHPSIFSFFEWLGIIEIEFVPENEYNPDYYLNEIKWDKIPLIISEPRTLFEDTYEWGIGEFNSDLFLEILAECTIPAFNKRIDFVNISHSQ